MPCRLAIDLRIQHRQSLVTQGRARREINVVDMESHVGSAPMSGEMLFNARIEAQIPDSTNMDSLVDALDDIANQMTLDIDLD